MYVCVCVCACASVSVCVCVKSNDADDSQMSGMSSTLDTLFLQHIVCSGLAPLEVSRSRWLTV